MEMWSEKPRWEWDFLPPNTTSLIQPMDQGIICAFKALYTRNTLQNLIEAMDLDEDFSGEADQQQLKTLTHCG
uniref:DDE-1 domain-containing protein n=1 Tax=Amphiprion percula TaxID=161767 RepID=A0A3P8TXQ8_AMPPE